MEGEYPIFMGTEKVGTASVAIVGLYWHITCRCTLTGKVLYRVLASCEGQEENLGVLIPQNGGFVLSTKVPVKRLRGENLAFRAVPRHTELKGKFIPLSPEEPFRYIERLKDAYLMVRSTGVCIVVPE